MENEIGSLKKNRKQNILCQTSLSSRLMTLKMQFQRDSAFLLRSKLEYRSDSITQIINIV